MITEWSFRSAFPFAVFLNLTLATSLSAGPLTIPMVSMAATKSGNDLILSFPTTTPDLYTVQSSADLLQWTNLQSRIQSDGTVKSVTVTNAFLVGKEFHRLLIERPASLLLPQSMAFAVLGRSCGGIREQAYVTGFDPTTGYPAGQVNLST